MWLFVQRAKESQQVWEEEIIYTLNGQPLEPVGIWLSLPFMKWDMILAILRATEEIATALGAVEWNLVAIL